MLLPTHHLLHVTPPLLECIENNPHNCMFIKTRDVYLARGNNAHSSKLDLIRGPLYINIPRNVHELPCLLINSEHGHAILVEGNNRLEYFYRCKMTWFPVHVMVKDGPVYQGAYEGIYKNEEEKDNIPVYMKKHYWLQNVKHVLNNVFDMETLDLQSYYCDSFFRF